MKKNNKRGPNCMKKGGEIALDPHYFEGKPSPNSSQFVFKVKDFEL